MKAYRKRGMHFYIQVLGIAALFFVSLATTGWSQDVYQQVSNTDELIKKYPSIYALTNVRIIVGNGQTVGNATIIMQNGLIYAIGSNVQVPNEAEIVDGTGLTVYPGLIDAHTTLGFGSGGRRGGGRGGFTPQQPQQQPGGRGQQQQQPDVPPNTRAFDANLRPDKVASDDIDFNDDNFKAAREAGITAALSINRQGVFPGKSSIVSTLVVDPVRGVIKSPIFQFIQYSNIRRGYPSTLMAVVAFQRQSLMDAKYYMDLEELYAKSGRGMERPVYDPVLKDLFPVIRGEETVIISVSQENDIKRAVSLVKQFNLKYMLSGVVEGYRPSVIELLKQENVPLIVSVNYPQARSTTGYSFNMQFNPFERTPPAGETRQARGGNPNEELERMIEDQLHGNANAIYKAGISFVLSSGGGYSDFLQNVRLAVSAGLPSDVALAKLTTEPAKLFGISEVLGTVERGKIANLVVTDGDLFDANTVIKYVFVDGKKIDLTNPLSGQNRNR